MIYDYKESTGELKLGSEMIYLSPKENCIFKELYKHKNETVKKEILIEALTEDGYKWYDNHYLPVLIHRINKKIKEELEIEKRYGIGYILKVR